MTISSESGRTSAGSSGSGAPESAAPVGSPPAPTAVPTESPPASAAGAEALGGSTRKSGWRRRLRERPGGRRQDVWFLGIATAWVVFDQVTKVITRELLDVGEHWELASFFRFSHIMNDGAAFGLLGDANGFLAISAVVAIAVIAAYYLFPPVDHWATRTGLALILGGAVGNFLDRIYQGSVTDFINFSHFPAFNVADAGINIGVAVIVIHMLVSDARRSATHR